MNAQNGEFYSLESALQKPQEVKSLFLNYSFQEIRPISKEISNLYNLESLTLFPRLMDYPKIVDRKVVSNTLDDSPLKTPEELPENIASCTKIKQLRLGMSAIKRLPTNVSDLKMLEELDLRNTAVNLDMEIEKILQLKNLKILSIAGCQISPENKSRLKAQFPNLNLFRTEDNLKKDLKENKTVNIQFHSTYLSFGNEQQANQFINSLPVEIANFVQIQR